MYFQTDTRFEVDRQITDILAGGWYQTFPLCDAGTYSYSFETDDPQTGFDIFVLPPGADAAGVSAGNTNVYVGCGKAGMHTYSGTCTVTYGAFIYILNTSYSSAIRLSGTIVSLDDPPWPNMTWDQEAYQYDDEELEYYWQLFH